MLRMKRMKDRGKEGERKEEDGEEEREEKGKFILLVFPTGTTARWVLSLDVPHIVLTCLILSDAP